MGVGQKCDRKVGGSRGQRRCSRLVVTSWREHELVGAMAGQEEPPIRRELQPAGHGEGGRG